MSESGRLPAALRAAVEADAAATTPPAWDSVLARSVRRRRARSAGAAAAVLAVVGAVTAGAGVLGERGAQAPDVLAGARPTTTPATARTAPPGPMCRSDELAYAVTWRRQGRGLVGDLVASNTGTRACDIQQRPRFDPLDADGRPLDADYASPADGRPGPLVLRPGQSAVSAIMFLNWCGPAPGGALRVYDAYEEFSEVRASGPAVPGCANDEKVAEGVSSDWFLLRTDKSPDPALSAAQQGPNVYGLLAEGDVDRATASDLSLEPTNGYGGDLDGQYYLMLAGSPTAVGERAETVVQRDLGAVLVVAGATEDPDVATSYRVHRAPGRHGGLRVVGGALPLLDLRSGDGTSWWFDVRTGAFTPRPSPR